LRSLAGFFNGLILHELNAAACYRSVHHSLFPDTVSKAAMVRLTAGLTISATFGRPSVRLAVAGSFLLLLTLSTGGCVEQLLTVDSEPSGAVVTLNDQEVGRTPVTTNFKWYGFYEADVRKDGFQTVKKTSPVIAPWWNWMPFDLFAELIPVRYTDHQYLHYTLQPMTARQDDPARLLRQGERLRSELQSGANEPRTRQTKPATTKPTTQNAKPSTRPNGESSTEPVG